MNSLGKLEPLLRKYAESTGVRAMVAIIPYIGGALDILMASEIQKKSLERYQKLIYEISDQMKDLDEKMIDHSYLESDEFYDLFIQISNLAVKTRLQEKVKAYARILNSSFNTGFKNRLNPEDILNIIEDLTENDIYLIKLIAECNDYTMTAAGYLDRYYHNHWNRFKNEWQPLMGKESFESFIIWYNAEVDVQRMDYNDVDALLRFLNNAIRKWHFKHPSNIASN